ncbi:MAG: RNA polymerase sigma factor [Gemmatimonadota bacterium]
MNDSTEVLSDGELVRRGRRGDERALTDLVKRHHAAVYRTALAILSNPEDAKDVAQGAFLKAFRGLDGFRGDAAFRTWLLTITANEARGVLRRRSRRAETTLEKTGPVASGNPGPDEAAVRADEVRRARSLLDRLPEKQKMAVRLRIDEGLSFKEIGAVIGSSEGAARVNYFHGINRLREWMT